MKKQLTAVAIALLSTAAITYTSCTIDECKDVVCQNGGNCNGGSCTCPTGFTGNRCQNAATGTIQFVNNSTNPYSVYLNGAFKQTMPGKTSVTFTVNYGYYTCRVVQQSGFVLTPTDQSYSGTVSASSNLIVSFP